MATVYQSFGKHVPAFDLYVSNGWVFAKLHAHGWDFNDKDEVERKMNITIHGAISRIPRRAGERINLDPKAGVSWVEVTEEPVKR